MIEGVHSVAPNLLVVQIVKDTHKNCMCITVCSSTKFYCVVSARLGWPEKRTESELFYRLYSDVIPLSEAYPLKAAAAPLTASEAEVFCETKVKSFDSIQFETEEVVYPFKDGTKTRTERNRSTASYTSTGTTCCLDRHE